MSRASVPFFTPAQHHEFAQLPKVTAIMGWGHPKSRHWRVVSETASAIDDPEMPAFTGHGRAASLASGMRRAAC